MLCVALWNSIFQRQYDTKSCFQPNAPVHLFEVTSQLKTSFHATAMMLIALINRDLGYSLPHQQARVNGENLDVKQCHYKFLIELHTHKLNVRAIKRFRFAWDMEVLLRVTARWNLCPLTLILRRSRTGTVWFYTSTSNKRAARPKLYTGSLTRDLKRMYSRFTLVRISINL